jgi:hypothetical protein
VTLKEPSGVGYRHALGDIRAQHPAAATAIAAHVEHLQRLFAGAQAQQTRMAERIRSLSRQAVAAAPTTSENFLLIDTGGSPIAMTSTEELINAAITLLGHLRANRNTPDELAARCQETGIQHGEFAINVFAAALQIAVTTELTPWGDNA